MAQQHPITPPPELVQEWFSKALKEKPSAAELTRIIAGSAAQWGADQELEACCEWLMYEHDRQGLRAARRPKPPSLKEQALQALNDAVKVADDAPPEGIRSDQADIIRRALEQLND